MRLVLVCLYVLSALFLGWIFLASIIAVDNQTISELKTDISYSPAFSSNVVTDLNLRLFGSARYMLMFVSSVGLIIQLPVLYKLIKNKNILKKSKKYRTMILYSWLSLFSPYFVLLIFTSI